MNLFRPVRGLLGALSVALGFISGLGAASRADADPAMWVVKDADSTVYLLGTIHIMKPGVSWRSEKLDAALKSSDEYWMEADVAADPAIAQTYVLNFGMDSHHPLSGTLGEAHYAKLLEVAERYHMPADQLPQMRPWLVTMLLSRAQMTSVGYDPELGVDRTLEQQAVADGKPVKAFETASEQLGFLADMPDKVSAEMLVQTLDELDEGVKAVDALEAAWLAGDVKRLQKIGPDLMRKESPELFDAMILRRNANWVKQIDAMLKGSGTQFIAVGAAHLIGPDSVPEQLGKLGYKVERY
jgi:uncharacterized protein YbaP (TraB family)